MSVQLLQTKLFIPPPHPNQVPRSRLIQRLDVGLRLGYRLTLVSAPAGSGETSGTPPVPRVSIYPSSPVVSAPHGQSPGQATSGLSTAPVT
jgi:hypothetical protein